MSSPTKPLLTSGSWHTEAYDVPAYLTKLGMTELATAPADPSLSLLSRLHEAHVRTIPFGNVDILLGRHPGVEPPDIVDQLVRRDRGGYCFEHAQLFAAALEHLGFTVTRSLGRVHDPTNSRTHMSVVAELDDARWLCDPGFGFSITQPIELTDGAVSVNAVGREFTIRQRADGPGTTWELMRDGKTEHILDQLPVQPVDVLAGHLFTSTHPSSPFTRSIRAMRYIGDEHITVTDRARTVRRAGTPSVQEELDPGDVVSSVIELGIDLDDNEQARLLATIEGPHKQ